MIDSISWFAIRVAPQSEFRVLYALNQRDRPAIVPFEEQAIPRRNRPNLTRWTKRPLMPGYVFGAFQGGRDAALSDFWTERQEINRVSEALGKGTPVLGVLGFGPRPEVMGKDQIEYLQGLSREKQDWRDPNELRVGQIVTVYGQRTTIEEITREEVRAYMNWLGGMRLVSVQRNVVTAALFEILYQ